MALHKVNDYGRLPKESVSLLSSLSTCKDLLLVVLIGTCMLSKKTNFVWHELLWTGLPTVHMCICTNMYGCHALETTQPKIQIMKESCCLWVVLAQDRL